jgi:hypothetical protein
MNQHDFVEGCLRWYLEADLQPGNPEDGEWHECHYPAPKCLGGTETVLLLKEHHAIQGVLQSEEYDHPCIWGWEKPFLPGEYVPLWQKWMSKKAEPAVRVWAEIPHEVMIENSRRGSQNQSLQDKVKGGVNCQALRTPEEKTDLAKHMHNITPEKRAEAVKKAVETNLYNNSDHFSDMGKKAREMETQEVRSARGYSLHAERLPDGRSVRGVEINLRTNSTFYKCLKTGHVSTAGPLTLWQRARDIDTSLRERIN